MNISLKDKIKILIVDDDLEICQLLSQYFDTHGFSVSSVNNGIELDAFLNEFEVDLIILDLMLPGENGLSILKRMQNQAHIPIIMLSASAEDVDRIVGLEIGADDYLTKPFNPRELLARIHSVLRRQGGQENKSPEKYNYIRSTKRRQNDRKDIEVEDHKHIHTFGPYIFNTNNQVLHRNGEKVTLTSGELSLLNIFVKNPKQVLSRDILLEKLKGYDCAPFDRTIDVRIMRLRQKIEINTAKPTYIQTVWGQGYKFIPNQSHDFIPTP
jgi:two-component system phosphate regulon response regulator OmpR